MRAEVMDTILIFIGAFILVVIVPCIWVYDRIQSKRKTERFYQKQAQHFTRPRGIPALNNEYYDITTLTLK
jgi:hypothetical protein